MSGPQRYPLAWPPHRPRTPGSRRKAELNAARDAALKERES